MTPYNDILNLKAKGFTNSEIARTAGCSRTTVIFVLRHIQLFPAEELQGLSDLEIHRKLRVPPKRSASVLMPDVNRDRFAVALGFSKQQRYQEYLRDCQGRSLAAYSRSHFFDLIGPISPTSLKCRARVQIMRKNDSEPAFLVGIFGLSQLVKIIPLVGTTPRYFAHALNDLLFQIGVCPAIVSTRRKAPKEFLRLLDEVVAFYQAELDFDQYGQRLCKSVAEVLYERYPTVSGEQARELVLEIEELFNKRSVPDYGIRTEDAWQLEKQFFQHLPSQRFILTEKRSVIVQGNFHVAIDGRYYSAPYTLSHQQLEAFITDDALTLCKGEEIICRHQIPAVAKSKYSTNADHMPKTDSEIPVDETSGTSLRRWARSIGPNTFAAINKILNSAEFEPQAFKTCEALLHLSVGGIFRRRGLEHAFTQVKAHPKWLNDYQTIVSLMEQYLQNHSIKSQ